MRIYDVVLAEQAEELKRIHSKPLVLSREKPVLAESWFIKEI